MRNRQMNMPSYLLATADIVHPTPSMHRAVEIDTNALKLYAGNIHFI